MRIWEIYKAIHKEAKRLGVENHPDVIKHLNEEERLVRSMFLVDDYRDSELDEFIKEYAKDLPTVLPDIGTFYVKVSFLPEAMGSKILIAKRQFTKDDPDFVRDMTNDRMGEFEDTGSLFFNDESAAESFIMALKLRFVDSDREFIIT